VRWRKVGSHDLSCGCGGPFADWTLDNFFTHTHLFNPIGRDIGFDLASVDL
jgi:hypothetical protein